MALDKTNSRSPEHFQQESHSGSKGPVWAAPLEIRDQAAFKSMTAPGATAQRHVQSMAIDGGDEWLQAQLQRGRVSASKPSTKDESNRSRDIGATIGLAAGVALDVAAISMLESNAGFAAFVINHALGAAYAGHGPGEISRHLTPVGGLALGGMALVGSDIGDLVGGR